MDDCRACCHCWRLAENQWKISYLSVQDWKSGAPWYHPQVSSNKQQIGPLLARSEISFPFDASCDCCGHELVFLSNSLTSTARTSLLPRGTTSLSKIWMVSKESLGARSLFHFEEITRDEPRESPVIKAESFLRRTQNCVSQAGFGVGLIQKKQMNLLFSYIN